MAQTFALDWTADAVVAGNQGELSLVNVQRIPEAGAECEVQEDSVRFAALEFLGRDVVALTPFT
jgi:hypothetical protein